MSYTADDVRHLAHRAQEMAASVNARLMEYADAMADVEQVRNERDAWQQAVALLIAALGGEMVKGSAPAAALLQARKLIALRQAEVPDQDEALASMAGARAMVSKARSSLTKYPVPVMYLSQLDTAEALLSTAIDHATAAEWHGMAVKV